MKKHLLYLLLAVCCFACKKDKEPDKQPLLSKVYEDGLLKLEYFYSSDKLPQRRNAYNTGSGQSVSAGFRLYQYVNGQPTEMAEYNKENQLSSRYTVQYDLNKRPSRIDYYTSSNTLTTYYTLDYDAVGKLTAYAAYTAGSNKQVMDAQFKYDKQGNIANLNRYTWSGPTKVKHDSSNFVFETKVLPTAWAYYELIPLIALPEGDKLFYEMTLISSMRYYVDAPPTITETNYTSKEYNEQGLLIKQRINYKSTYIGAPTISTTEKTYQYTE